MAKARVSFPLDSINGTIAGPDRTIGRDVGLASSLRKINAGVSGDSHNQPRTQLYATTAPTRGGSAARHMRSRVYCDCDGAFKVLPIRKSAYLQPWWKAATGGGFVSMGNYQIYMKICLKGLLEYQAFLRFSYCSRFRIVNNSLYFWYNQPVILTGIPTFQPDGMDLEVYLLLGIATKKGRIVYAAKMIDYRLPHDVYTRGQAVITISDLAQGESIYVDVYSYYRGG